MRPCGAGKVLAMKCRVGRLLAVADMLDSVLPDEFDLQD